MLPGVSVPASLWTLLSAFRSCFRAPTFTTFVALVVGFIAQTGQRTVCGMLVGAGLERVWAHDRAHRFFATARWCADEVGLALAALIVQVLLPPDAPLVVAVDDTLFRRSGKRSTPPIGITTRAPRKAARSRVATVGSSPGWSSTCRVYPGRCACRSWCGCGRPRRRPRSSTPANSSPSSPTISRTAWCMW